MVSTTSGTKNQDTAFSRNTGIPCKLLVILGGWPPRGKFPRVFASFREFHLRKHWFAQGFWLFRESHRPLKTTSNLQGILGILDRGFHDFCGFPRNATFFALKRCSGGWQFDNLGGKFPQRVIFRLYQVWQKRTRFFSWKQKCQKTL